MGFLRGTSGKEYSAGDRDSVSWLGGSPGGGNGNPLVFLPRKFHGQRSLAGYSLKVKAAQLCWTLQPYGL